MVDGPPEVAHLPVDLQVDLVEAPPPVAVLAHRPDPRLADLAGEHRPEPVPPPFQPPPGEFGLTMPLGIFYISVRVGEFFATPSAAPRRSVSNASNLCTEETSHRKSPCRACR